MVIECPHCGKNQTKKPLKKWKFGTYDVSRYNCQHCKDLFNYYSNSKKTWTLPKSKF
jgi:transposase-like protein